MNQREKILAILAFSATGILLLAFVATKVILGPTADYRAKAKQVALDVEKMQMKNSMEPIYQESLREAALRSYGSDASVASEMSRAHLVRLIIKAGLAPDDLTLTPVTGSSVRGGREVGWNVRIKGSLERLTNLLYVINNDPHLHRLDTITWSPIANSTDLTLQARFVTLVLEPVDGVKPEDIKPESLVNDVQLASADRKVYSLIDDRDIFRPYIKRPPPPPPIQRPPVATGPRTPGPTPPPPTPAAPTFQLVGLPTWGDVTEIVVKNSRDGKSVVYKVGQDFLNGEIVMVDYRPLPLPKQPLITSSSRVIVRVGRDYWALELGQFVTEKYLLTGDRLPETLRGSQPVKSPPLPGKTPGDSDVVKPLGSDSTNAATSLEVESVPVSQEAGHAP